MRRHGPMPGALPEAPAPTTFLRNAKTKLGRCGDPSQLGRRIEVSACRDTEQHPPLARPPGGAWENGCRHRNPDVRQGAPPRKGVAGCGRTREVHTSRGPAEMASRARGSRPRIQRQDHAANVKRARIRTRSLDHVCPRIVDILEAPRRPECRGVPPNCEVSGSAARQNRGCPPRSAFQPSKTPRADAIMRIGGG